MSHAFLNTSLSLFFTHNHTHTINYNRWAASLWDTDTYPFSLRYKLQHIRKSEKLEWGVRKRKEIKTLPPSDNKTTQDIYTTTLTKRSIKWQKSASCCILRLDLILHVPNWNAMQTLTANNSYSIHIPAIQIIDIQTARNGRYGRDNKICIHYAYTTQVHNNTIVTFKNWVCALECKGSWLEKKSAMH